MATSAKPQLEGSGTLFLGPNALAAPVLPMFGSASAGSAKVELLCPNPSVKESVAEAPLNEVPDESLASIVSRAILPGEPPMTIAD